MQTILRLVATLSVAAQIGVNAVPLRAGDEPEVRKVRLRFEWSTPEPQLWHGLVEITDGRLEDPYSHRLDADEPGTIWIDGSALWIRRRASRSYDGFDVTAHATADSELTIALPGAGADAGVENRSIPLATLDDAATTVELGGGGTLEISRRPGDQLSVETGREGSIYEPGEPYSATVGLNLLKYTEGKPTPARLEWTITRTETAEVVERRVIELPRGMTSLPVKATLPGEEGAYDLAFSWTRRGQNALSAKRQVLVLGNTAVSAPAEMRLVGAYLPKPTFLEVGPDAGAWNWNESRSAAQQFARQLTERRYNAALIAVAADGSAVYPSTLLQPTSRYGSTPLVADVDPTRRDVLELLYREFAREQLVLVPELQFATPLPALEKTIASEGDAARGIELVGQDGRSWRESRGALEGLAPCYNPLDPRVQDAVTAVVEEFVQRYQSRPELRAIAIQLSSDGYLQLPGLSWGYDDATVERFAAATRTDLPDAAGDDRFRARHEFLTTTVREQWIEWRCAQLAGFHTRLASVVTSAAPHVQVIFTTAGMLDSPNAEDNLLEAAKAGSKPEALLKSKGLDFARYDGIERLTVLRPMYFEPDGPRRSSVRSVNENPAFDLALSQKCRGALLVTPAAATDGTSTGGDRLMADALAAKTATMIFDSSWDSAVSDAPAVRLRKLITRLPAVPFHTVECPQPVVLRTATFANKTYVYAVNKLDGAASVQLRLSGKGHNGITLPQKTPIALESTTPEGATVRVELAPRRVWACEFAVPVRIEGATVQTAPEAIAKMEERLKQLDMRLSALQSPVERNDLALSNGGFEIGSETTGGLPAWDIVLPDGATWSLDTQDRHSGNAALLLTSETSDETKLSSPVSLGSHHMLTLGVWMRSDRESADMRLGIAAAVDQSLRQQFADVKVGTEWRRYLLRVKDIPAGTIEDGRITLTLRSPARLWIDDADVRFDRLSNDEMRQLTKLFSAVSLAWQDQRYADCQRLLESYWGAYLFEEPSVESAVEAPTRTTRRESNRRIN